MMNPLQRSLIEKAGNDNGFEHVLASATNGVTFAFDHARSYGFTRDEPRYILGPADVMGDDYPSETFCVLKNNEMREFGEYRTRRLVLEAWDILERGALA